MRPLVSILLPCYNAEKYLRVSLESILSQDYDHLEVICINDGSHDRTLDLLEEYRSADTRIKIIDNKKNLGLIDSLNIGMEHITGSFFGRMDADDYSAPDRISRQMEFLRQNPAIDLISSGYNYFIKDGRKLEYVPPIATLPQSLKFATLFATPFTHGAVLGKTSLIQAGLFRYDKDYMHSEDYELFPRLVWTGIKVSNLRPSLYWLRINPESVSVVYNTLQIATHLKITRRNLEQHVKNGQQLDEEMLKILSNRLDAPISTEALKTALKFLFSCSIQSEEKSASSNAELREIRNYLCLHSLNILIQSNKIGFRDRKIKNLGFFVRSLFFFKLGHIPLVFVKLYNFLCFRIRQQ